MKVTINGLQSDDEAELQILPELAVDQKPIYQYTIKGDITTLTTDIIVTLEDDYYKLVLQAPCKYFHDPRSYLFMVYQSQLINPGKKPIIFDLIPPEKQSI